MIKFLFKKKKSSKLSFDFETFLNTKLGIKPLNGDLYLEAITHKLAWRFRFGRLGQKMQLQ